MSLVPIAFFFCDSNCSGLSGCFWTVGDFSLFGSIFSIFFTFFSSNRFSCSSYSSYSESESESDEFDECDEWESELASSECEEILDSVNILTTEDLFRLVFGNKTRDDLLVELEAIVEQLTDKDLDSFQEELEAIMAVDTDEDSEAVSDEEYSELTFER